MEKPWFNPQVLWQQHTHITGCSATQTCEVQKPRGIKRQLIVTLDLDMLLAPNTHVHGRKQETLVQRNLEKTDGLNLCAHDSS